MTDSPSLVYRILKVEGSPIDLGIWLTFSILCLVSPVSRLTERPVHMVTICRQAFRFWDILALKTSILSTACQLSLLGD